MKRLMAVYDHGSECANVPTEKVIRLDLLHERCGDFDENSLVWVTLTDYEAKFKKLLYII